MPVWALANHDVGFLITINRLIVKIINRFIDNVYNCFLIATGEVELICVDAEREISLS